MSNVIDLEGMTPEEKRALAEQIASDGAAPARKPYMRSISVDGVSLDVDMRRVEDYRALALIAKVEQGDAFAAISLFDFILGPERDRCIEELSDGDGFCPVGRFSSFCARVLEAVGAKN